MGGLFGSNTIHNKASKVANFQINSATYGAVVPLIFGTTRISGNVIDYYDFTAIAHTTTQRTGKGGTKVKNTTYTYTVACLIGLSEGPIKGVGRVWRDEEILVNPSAMSLNVFTGEYGQQPWSYTQSKYPDRALPYSGLAYVGGVIELGESGSLPTLNFEVFGQLLDSGDGVDVNPADIINYIIFDEINGVGFGRGGIDSEGLQRYRDFCKAADLLVSTPPDTDTKKAYEIVNELCDATNTICFWSQNKLKLVPMCDEELYSSGVTYTPDTTPIYELNEDDFLEDSDGKLITFERGDNTEAFNQATIEFINRANNYEVETVDFPILVDINQRGLRPADTESIHYLHTKERAQYVAGLKAMKSLYVRNKYRFKLDWSYCLLEPGDFVTLTLPHLGLDKAPVTIEEIEEAEDGELEILAIPKPPGVYSPAQYPVHEADRPVIDYRVDPGDTAVVVFTPAPEIVTSGLEFWIAASGGEYWGGCNVWVSDSGSSYEHIGLINAPSRHGVLTETLPAGDAIDELNTLKIQLASSGQILGGTEQDAINLNTLCWVDGELIAYATAILTGDKQYSLTYLIRGVYDTPITAHGAGSRFVRLDRDMFKYPFTKDQVGRTVYFKFTSFNVYNTLEQNIDDVTPYEYVLSDVYVPHATDLTLVQHLREVRDGTNLYELEATWQPPNTPIYSYSDVYLKTSQPTWDEVEATIDELEDMTIDDMSNADIWKYIGKANESIVIPGCTTGHTFTVKVVTVVEGDFKADFNTAPTVEHLVEIKSYIPQMPQNLSVVFTDVCQWSWDDPTDTDNDYYELRLDTNYGASNNLLAKTSSNKVIAQPANRQGNVYLYAHNRSGKYSPGAHLEYNKPAPEVPSNITIVEVFQGLVITCAALPVYGLGINVHIDDGEGDKVYFSPTNSYTFTALAGIYDIRVAYVDLFGEGNLSEAQQAVIKATIDPELLAAESISLEKMDIVVQEAIEKAKDAVSGVVFDETVNQLTQADTNIAAQITQTTSSIMSIITELEESNSSSIAQLIDAINLRVTTTDFDEAMQPQQLITQINLAPGTITLDGKLIHITGQTLIDDNVIVTGMIQTEAVTAEKIAANAITAEKIAAGAITADSLGVTELSAITAKIGTLRTATSGARTEIKDNLICVYDANNILRVRMGVW